MRLPRLTVRVVAITAPKIDTKYASRTSLLRHLDHATAAPISSTLHMTPSAMLTFKGSRTCDNGSRYCYGNRDE